MKPRLPRKKKKIRKKIGVYTMWLDGARFAYAWYLLGKEAARTAISFEQTMKMLTTIKNKTHGQSEISNQKVQ